jgi:thiol:disulfide interchange protein DsbD
VPEAKYSAKPWFDLRLRVAAAAVMIAMLAMVAAPAGAALPRPDQVVRITSAALAENTAHQTVLRVDATILPGWHINSDRPSSPDYIATALSVKPPDSVAVKSIQYPPAEMIAPAFSMGEKLSVFTGAITFRAELAEPARIKPGEQLPFTLSLDYQACNDRQCLRPVTISKQVSLQWPDGIAKAGPALKVYAQAPAAGAPSDKNLFTSYGFALGFLMVFLGGLALNLTPCVYPLIGVTLAYFGNQGGGGTRRVLILALLYVTGIALMFSAVGTAAALSGGLFGAALENPYVLAVIAGVMLLLAASSFGWFSLQAPAWMLQRAGAARPGYLGSLAMGLGMGIVAAPCIGPFVLGLLLIIEQSGSALLGFGTFFVLALGMGLPYIVLALAAGSIRSLPRSGQWLAWVEHLFGFVLIGLALYFIDPLLPGRLATRLLPYYGAAAGIYLGFLSPHGRQPRPFALFKGAVGTISAVALVYLLIPGGRMPALAFQPYDATRLSAAEAEHKPVLIDFGADWCIPCREMEHTTFRDPAVVSEARRFVALHADLTRLDSRTDDLVSEYRIQGVPTLVLLDGSGSVRKRMVGYIGPAEMLQSLKAVN